MEKEFKIAGEFGLKTKREIWRVQLTLARIRKAARLLLTLEETDPKRIFEGKALLNRMFKFGLLNPETENGLDYILSLDVSRFLDRRLQTFVLKNKLGKSIHDARVRIRQRHIMVNNQMVNVPSYMVTTENAACINFHIASPYGGGREGRLARMKNKNGGNDE